MDKSGCYIQGRKLYRKRKTSKGLLTSTTVKFPSLYSTKNTWQQLDLKTLRYDNHSTPNEHRKAQPQSHALVQVFPWMRPRRTTCVLSYAPQSTYSCMHSLLKLRNDHQLYLACRETRRIIRTRIN